MSENQKEIDQEKIDKARDEIESVIPKHNLANIEVLSLISSWFLEMLVYSPYSEENIDNILKGIKSEFLIYREQMNKEKENGD